MNWLKKLGKDNRGSRPRCVLLTDGRAERVAERLTRVVRRSEVVVSSGDCWQPQGTCDVGEAQLNKPLKGSKALVPDSVRCELGKWWLAKDTGQTATPHWDIASTCTISGQTGLLLVEAKAHSKELSRRNKCGAAPVNRKQIENALGEANAGLRRVTGGSWELSAEHHFQLANRFAWSWKLASLGVPVVLLYLGFLDAVEMRDRGSPFGKNDDWRDSLLEHCRSVVDVSCWERTLDIGGTPLLPLIRTGLQPFEPR